VLTHPTLDQLHALGLYGMAKAYGELDKHGDTPQLAHAEWLGLLLDREIVHRHDKRLGARLRHARLRHNAAPEDIDYRSARGLDRRLVRGSITDVTRQRKIEHQLEEWQKMDALAQLNLRAHRRP